jgi:hypothetical protein
MIEWLRDKTRDNLTRDISSLGITAIMSKRNRPEEKIVKTWYQRSLGIIDIGGEAVKWINILKNDGSEDSPPQWWIVFGIPDEKGISQTVNIKTIKKKRFPVLGTVVDVTWKGNDSATGLIDLLSLDEEIKNFTQSNGNLAIRSHTGKFQGWTLQVDERFKPTDQDWATIRKIAKYMLLSTHYL